MNHCYLNSCVLKSSGPFLPHINTGGVQKSLKALQEKLLDDASIAASLHWWGTLSPLAFNIFDSAQEKKKN